MKRWICKLVLFLLLGAVVNVAVAWGCAAWVDNGPSGMSSKIATTRTPQGYIWLVRNGSARGAERVLSGRVLDNIEFSLPGEGNWPPDLIPSWSTISHEIDPAGPKTADFQVQDARGWPMLSMRCTFLRDWASVGLRSRSEVVGGLELPPRTWTGGDSYYSNARALPYIPIPLGFVVDTLFYALFLWLLTLGPFTARRLIRRKRGHCIKCGYDLRGDFSAGCPECGWRREVTS